MYLLLIILHLLLPVREPDMQKIALKDLQGKVAHIDLSKGTKATVLFFLSPECPLCQSYSLTINQLQKTYATQGFQFIAIVPGKDFPLKDVIEFRNHYQLKSIAFWFDPNYTLAKYCSAEITPEAFVYLPNGKKVYQGRIDNWAYELARKRKVITEHDLRDVLEKLSKNQTITFNKTKAVGCFIN